MGNDFILRKVGTFRHDIALPVMHYRVQYCLLNLAFSIIMGVRIGRSVSDFFAVRPVLDAEDFSLLSHDAKTLDLIEETEKAYRIRHNLFVKSKKTIRTA